MEHVERNLSLGSSIESPVASFAWAEAAAAAEPQRSRWGGTLPRCFSPARGIASWVGAVPGSRLLPGMRRTSRGLSSGLLPKELQASQGIVAALTAGSPALVRLAARAHVDPSAGEVEALGCRLSPVNASAAHRWLFARVQQSLGAEVIWNPEERVGACGDWTHGSRVEDAFTSGLSLARTILGDRPAQLKLA